MQLTSLSQKIQKSKRITRYSAQMLLNTLGAHNSIPDNALFLNVQHPLKYRFLYHLVRHLAALDYSVFLYVSSLRDLVQLGRLDGHLDWLGNTKVVSSLPADTSRYAVCCDHEKPLLEKPWERIYKLEFDLSKPRDELRDIVYLPFSVHDYIHRCCFSRRDELLKNQRSIRLLFAGEYRGYSGNPIGTHLGKMEREEVIRNFRAFEHTRVIRNLEQLEVALRAPYSPDSFYLVDVQNFRVPAERWLEVLSQVEVFLSPPGVVNPMSYNINEALTMGAIPLTNYGEWFHPHLENGKTCFTFHDPESLHSQLSYIANLDRQELARIRAHVLAYYDDHLTLDAFVRKVRNTVDHTVTLVINAEQTECLKNIDVNSLAVSLH